MTAAGPFSISYSNLPVVADKTPTEGSAVATASATFNAELAQVQNTFNLGAGSNGTIGLSQVRALGVLNPDPKLPLLVTHGVNQQSYTVRANGGAIISTTSNGLVYPLTLTYPSLPAQQDVVQITFFNYPEPPADWAAVTAVSVENAEIPISGDVNANITNAEITITGQVGAVVTNTTDNPVNITGDTTINNTDSNPVNVGPVSVSNTVSNPVNVTGPVSINNTDTSPVNISGPVTASQVGTWDVGITGPVTVNGGVSITGSVDTNITNSSLTVTGDVGITGGVNANITNSSLNATILNSSLAVNGDVGITGPVDANITNVNLDVSITNSVIPIAGNVSIPGGVSITNASIDVNANITNSSIGANISNANIQTSSLNEVVTTINRNARPALQIATSSSPTISTLNDFAEIVAANPRRQDLMILCSELPTAGLVVSICVNNSTTIAVLQTPVAAPDNCMFTLDQVSGVWKGALQVFQSGTGGAGFYQITEFSQGDYSLSGISGAIFATPPSAGNLFGVGALSNQSTAGIQQSNGFPLGPNCTLEMWFCQDGVKGGSPPVGIVGSIMRVFGPLPSGSTNGLQINTDGLTGAISLVSSSILPQYNKTVSGHTNVCDGKWHHIALVSENTETIAYIDGIAEVSLPVAMNFTNSGGIILPVLETTPIGYITEIACWSLPRYLGNFTPQFCAYTGQEVGLFALWHLNSDLKDTGPGILIS